MIGLSLIPIARRMRGKMRESSARRARTGIISRQKPAKYNDIDILKNMKLLDLPSMGEMIRTPGPGDPAAAKQRIHGEPDPALRHLWITKPDRSEFWFPLTVTQLPHRT